MLDQDPQSPPGPLVADAEDVDAVVTEQIGLDGLPVLVDQSEEAGDSPRVPPACSSMIAARIAADPPAAMNAS